VATPTWVDPQTAHNPTTGNSIPAAWGDQVRDNGVFSHTSPGAKVARTSNQSGVSTSTFTAVSWSLAQRDTDTMWSGGSPTRVTSKFSGWYDCKGYGYYTASGGTLCQLAFRVNGATYYAALGNDGSIQPALNLSDLIYLAATDYVELMFWQNSGGSMTIAEATMAVTWAGA
jgi:hypothetical protein